MLQLKERYLPITESELAGQENYVRIAFEELKNRTSPGSDYLDWFDWPETFDKSLLDAVEEVKEQIVGHSDVLISIGIGGSYLGAKAVYEALCPPFGTIEGGVEVIFAGQNLSDKYLNGLLGYLEDKDFSLNVISKSGTTTEPALAFRVLRDLLIERYGEEGLKERCFITTDKEKGALKTFADENGLKTFVVPDGIGGRYSVTSAVGLLPLAVGGVDVRALMDGSLKAYRELTKGDLQDNAAFRYAAIRYLMYLRGAQAESLVTFEPELSYFAEWWKQLFGESEGKDGKALLPVSMQFTRDLHSLGQFVQDGRNILLETCLSVKEQDSAITVQEDPENIDGLNYLAGKTYPEINNTAKDATLMAHFQGGVPVLEIELAKLDAAHVGYLIYFFELSCGISARLLGVNPFDQPGVEAYKQNMFALLGKPGFEARREDLLKQF